MINKYPAAKFAKLWADESMSLRQIAEIVGYSCHKSVIAKAKALGLPPRRAAKTGRRPFVNCDNRAEFVRLVRDGRHTKIIARRFGVTPQAVRQTIARLGIVEDAA